MEEQIKKVECYDLIIDDNDDTQINFMSMVEDPAIKMDFVAFSNNPAPKVLSFKIQNSEKRMLTGVFMIPDQLIRRVDEDGGEYFVKFSADNIERGVKKFFKQGNQSQVDTEHNNIANGCYIVDSWFIRDPESNPLKAYGFSDLKAGSWVGTVHVPSDEIWNDYIKTGKLKGFSVEGLFKFGKKQMVTGFSGDGLNDEERRMIDELAEFLANG